MHVAMLKLVSKDADLIPDQLFITVRASLCATLEKATWYVDRRYEPIHVDVDGDDEEEQVSSVCVSLLPP